MDLCFRNTDKWFTLKMVRLMRKSVAQKKMKKIGGPLEKPQLKVKDSKETTLLMDLWQNESQLDTVE